MNKKILFLILFAAILVFPYMAQADEAQKMVCAVKNAVFGVGTIIVVIGWVIAGILWLVSAGSPEKTGIAKKATWAAVIGTILIIVANVSWTVVNDLLGNPATGINLYQCVGM